MAYEKYIVQVGDNVTIALKYNLERKEVILGGLIRFIDTMNAVISEYYKQGITTPIMVQRNKIRFVFSCSYVKHREALELMKEHAIIVILTANHGNIMR